MFRPAPWPTTYADMDSYELSISDRGDLTLEEFVNLLDYSLVHRAWRAGYDPEAVVHRPTAPKPKEQGAVDYVMPGVGQSSHSGKRSKLSTMMSKLAHPRTERHPVSSSRQHFYGYGAQQSTSAMPLPPPLDAGPTDLSPHQKRIALVLSTPLSDVRLMCLIIEFAPGRYNPRHEDPKWLRGMLDGGSKATWTLHPRYFISQYGASNFAMFNSDGSYARSQDYGGDLTVDVWHQQWPITSRLLAGTTYANKAKYWYTPVSAPVQIRTRGVQATDLGVLHYQLATSINTYLAGAKGFDSIMGFAPQALEDARGLQAAGRMDEVTFINQLTLLRRLRPFTRKVFVISPSYKRGKTSMLYIGQDATWPKDVQMRIKRPNIYDFRSDSQITIDVWPAPEQQHLSSWFVLLTEIGSMTTSGSERPLWVGRQETLLDTGAQMTDLPRAFFNKLVRYSRGNVSLESVVDGKRHYAVQDDYLNESEWIYLKFANYNGSQHLIVVGTLRDALAHRTVAGDYINGRMPMSFTSFEPSPSAFALIGMNWLKYFWQSYQDSLPSQAAISLARSH